MLIPLTLLSLVLSLTPRAAATEWQQPPTAVLEVLHAPDLPWVWTSPDGAHLLLADGVLYPPLAERAAPMYELAGVRVDPGTNSFHGESGATRARIRAVSGGDERPLNLPGDAVLLDVSWTADGERFALSVRSSDHVGLWVGDVGGRIEEIDGVALNPLLSDSVAWMPDQKHLLVKRLPRRGDPPTEPVIPAGPEIREGDGDKPRSTYESRNLLKSDLDDARFQHYFTSQISVVDAARGKIKDLGAPDLYAGISPSPDGQWILVNRLRPPWSRATAWWRFAHTVEVWTHKGALHTTLATLPVADEVPIHGVRLGMRGVSWRATAPASLYWIEALDGGDPMAEVPHRDKLMRASAPFEAAPEQVFMAQHRILGWWWGAEGGVLVLNQHERMRRWRHVWLLDVDTGSASPWFDLSENDHYGDPGDPVTRWLPNGRSVLRQSGDAVYFTGAGASPDGDRPFLDLRVLGGDSATRLYRSEPGVYERFIAFAGADEGQFLVRRETADEVPNYHLVTLGARSGGAAGEAVFARTMRPVTAFTDPTPVLRKVQKRIVTYAREDGVPLSFHLYLPPDYEEGKRYPTVLYAYPLEYSDAGTAGQVRGSEHQFTRLSGASHMFFLLQGYVVLNRTAMPVIGDPETAYDTFVEQLVADAEAAVAKAVELGVTDPDRVGITGHSHGGLMTATLLAHSDLFRAGIARSGAYNHTMRPFGFQRERRTLWEAMDTYVQLSPVMHAPKIDEPLLLIHGAIDENPGTIPFQSERLFEAVRGSGGRTRLVMLPYEGHGYRARESVEHVLWEQLQWFDAHVKSAPPRASEAPAPGHSSQ